MILTLLSVQIPTGDYMPLYLQLLLEKYMALCLKNKKQNHKSVQFSQCDTNQENIEKSKV